MPAKTVHSWERKRVQGLLCSCDTEGTLVPNPLHACREVGSDLTRATGNAGNGSMEPQRVNSCGRGQKVRRA